MLGEVSAVDGSVAYFQPAGYKSIFPNSSFSLAVVNGLLTAIGGKTSSYEFTNSLLTLTDDKWTEQFPPMPTHCWLTAVLCSSRSLVVAGEHKKLSTVEVMDTKTIQWSTASSLPHPLYCESTTLCGDQVYMLGGCDQRGEQSKSVFTCSLAALFQSLKARQRTLSLASRPKVRHQLGDTPVTISTCASLHGRRLSVGGKN